MSTTPQSLIAANFGFRDGTVKAAKRFAKSKPYRGTTPERRAKLEQFHAGLCKANSIDVDLVFRGDNNQLKCSGMSYLVDGDPRSGIVLVGRLSVITYLFLFAMELSGRNREKSLRWSHNLFQRSFPRSFEKLTINSQGLTQPLAN